MNQKCRCIAHIAGSTHSSELGQALNDRPSATSINTHLAPMRVPPPDGCLRDASEARRSHKSCVRSEGALELWGFSCRGTASVPSSAWVSSRAAASAIILGRTYLLRSLVRDPHSSAPFASFIDCHLVGSEVIQETLRRSAITAGFPKSFDPHLKREANQWTSLSSGLY